MRTVDTHTHTRESKCTEGGTYFSPSSSWCCSWGEVTALNPKSRLSPSISLPLLPSIVRAALLSISASSCSFSFSFSFPFSLSPPLCYTTYAAGWPALSPLPDKPTDSLTHSIHSLSLDCTVYVCTTYLHDYFPIGQNIMTVIASFRHSLLLFIHSIHILVRRN